MKRLASTGRLLTLAVMVVCGTSASSAKPSAPASDDSQYSPKESIKELWRNATRGDLMTRDGWYAASDLWVHATPLPGTVYVTPPPPGNGAILVISNEWGPAIHRSELSRQPKEGDIIEVMLWFADRGRIDSSLRYAPPQNSEKHAGSYRFVFFPTHWVDFRSDKRGLLVVNKQMAGPVGWQIQSSQNVPQGLPWTTVNTAIRYVLEKRSKTKNPTIRQNADKTLAELLRLH